MMRLLAPLGVLGLGILLLLQGLETISLSAGIGGAALLTVTGVALLVSGLGDDPAGDGGP